MKGVCEIKLIDKNKKVVHQEKSHNIVTNFFDEYFSELGPVKELPFDYEVENLIGGILLFQNTIEADADNVLLPAGNKMIGNGATLIVQGSGAEAKELGTYIADSTGWLDDDTYQLKFEWAPSQAVGTIRSVCLTSRAHGFIGEGNENSMGQRTTPGSSQTNYQQFGQDYNNRGADRGHNTIQSQQIHYCADNIAYRLVGNLAEGTIGVEKSYIPMSNVDFKTGSSGSTPKLIESRTYHIPTLIMDELRTYNKYMAVTTSEDGKIHFVIGRALYASGNNYYLFRVDHNTPNVYCYTYDTETDAFTYKQVNVYSYYGRDTGLMGFYDGKYLLALIDNFYAYVNQHSAVIDTDNSTMSDLGNSHRSREVTLYRCDNHQFYFCTNSYTDNEWRYGMKIDATRGVWSPINLSSSYISSKYKLKNKKLAGISTSTSKTYFTRHGDYLATIYNLPTAVTKTSDLTMQITYTLSFGGGE